MVSPWSLPVSFCMTRLRSLMLDWRADSSSAERDKALQVRSGAGRDTLIVRGAFAPTSCSSAQPVSIKGSWTNVARTMTRTLLLSRRSWDIVMKEERNRPSTPAVPIARAIMRVSLNGTTSARNLRFAAFSKQSPKSMWMTLPVEWSMSRFDGCLSPRPIMQPTIDVISGAKPEGVCARCPLDETT